MMITPDQAIAAAQERAQALGWSFAEPVRCTLRRGWFGGRDRFEIETNAGRRGTKARFTIDAGTGDITDEGYLLR